MNKPVNISGSLSARNLDDNNRTEFLSKTEINVDGKSLSLCDTFPPWKEECCNKVSQKPRLRMLTKVLTLTDKPLLFCCCCQITSTSPA